MYSTSWTLEVPHTIGGTVASYSEIDVTLCLDESCILLKVGVHPHGKSAPNEWIMDGADDDRGVVWDLAVAAVDADRWRISVEAGIPPEPLPDEYRPILGVHSRGRLVG